MKTFGILLAAVGGFLIAAEVDDGSSFSTFALIKLAGVVMFFLGVWICMTVSRRQKLVADREQANFLRTGGFKQDIRNQRF